MHWKCCTFRSCMLHCCCYMQPAIFWVFHTKRLNISKKPSAYIRRIVVRRIQHTPDVIDGGLTCFKYFEYFVVPCFVLYCVRRLVEEWAGGLIIACISSSDRIVGFGLRVTSLFVAPWKLYWHTSESSKTSWDHASKNFTLLTTKKHFDAPRVLLTCSNVSCNVACVLSLNSSRVLPDTSNWWILVPGSIMMYVPINVAGSVV